MTEPKRWTAGDIVALYMSDDQHWRDEFYAAADFDRLRDERDRLDYLWKLEAGRAREAEGADFMHLYDLVELRLAAGVLADALRGLLEREEYRSPTTDAAHSALAVFDTLTEEAKARAIAEEATRFECGDNCEAGVNALARWDNTLARLAAADREKPETDT